MKLKPFVLLSFSLCMLMAIPSFAQRKKVLKEENAKLKKEIAVIKRQNTQLKRENDDAQKNIEKLGLKISRLQQDSTDLNMNYNMLRADYESLKKQKAKADAENDNAGGDNPSGTVDYSVDPLDTRPCAKKAADLDVDASYRLNFSRLNLHGWGVQVYSFSSLCMAVERAKEFSSYYKMFNTYIRVKSVNGKRMYSVVYGSLKDEAQARTYCNNFRKIARDEEGQNAFIVQH